MMQLKKIFLKGLFIFFIVNLNAQSVIKGFVVDSLSKPIEYFNAVLLDAKDSSMLVGGAFIDGDFNISYPIQSACLLSISSIGYQEAYILINPDNLTILQLDTIQLKVLELELTEVVVTARRPVYSQKQGKLTLNVQLTPLSGVGTSIDVLKRTPGLQIDRDNNISIFGKGTPLVFIDDKEVQSPHELEILQSDDIVSIQIDRNPSALYNASASSVVRIKTKRGNAEGLSMEIYNRSYFARKFSNTSGVKANKTMGKFTNYVNYDVTKNQSLDYSKDYENNYQPGYTLYNRSSSVDRNKVLKHNLFFGSNFIINPKNELGAQFNYTNRNRDNQTNTEQEFSKTGEPLITRQIDQAGDKMYNQYNLSTIYKSTFDSLRSLLVVFDYAKINNDGAISIFERNITNSSIVSSSLYNNNLYVVYTLKTEYNFLFPENIHSLIGFKLSQINNEGGVRSLNEISETLNYDNTNSIKDQVFATYFTADREINKIAVHVGARGEYTSTRVQGDNEVILDSSYFNIFPSASLDYEISDKANITLSYAKKIKKPSFNELSPSIIYFDSLSYGQGNPLLKSRFSHNFSIDMELFNSLSFSLEYTYFKNLWNTVAIMDDENPDIVKYTPVNINKSEYAGINVNYNYSGKKLSTYASGGIEFPFVDIPYLNSIRKMREPSWYFQLNNDLSLSKYIGLYCNFSYESKGVDLMTKYDQTYDLSAGLNAKLFKKKFIIAFEASDILNTTDFVWNDKYGNIESGQRPDYDTRYVRVSLTYNFKNFKNIFKSQSGNEDELKRL